MRVVLTFSRFVRRKALKIHRLRFCLGEAGAIRGWLPTAGTEVHAAERKGCEREGKDPSTRPGGAKPGTSHDSRASGCSLRMTGGGDWVRIRPGPLPTAASREIGGCHLPRGGRQGRGAERPQVEQIRGATPPSPPRGDRRRHLPRGGRQERGADSPQVEQIRGATPPSPPRGGSGATPPLAQGRFYRIPSQRSVSCSVEAGRKSQPGTVAREWAW